MYKYSIFVSTAILCYAQCIPLDMTHNTSSSSSQLQLTMNNSTESTNYHLSPVMHQLENIDREIDEQLQAILPYLNFFFDTLFSQPTPPGDEDCINDMVIELVPDETAMPPKPDDNATPQSETVQPPVGDKTHKTPDDEPTPVSDVASTIEKPTDVQKNP